MSRSRITMVGIASLLLTLQGCSSFTDVKAYQKGKLAKPQMQLDRNPIRGSFDEHTYFSKEASSGGGGYGGGGCGCN